MKQKMAMFGGESATNNFLNIIKEGQFPLFFDNQRVRDYTIYKSEKETLL